ncbi:Nitronate monooxygenase [Cupriavidus taiwanensis]|uniref:NAD(P)H-dependent flavin oxidoreductase n=1 Tax=Cupriavidus taiwanensis TaxID=164546 RepID=UPI000E1598DE|nr:nitronate monooxygenase [Cupriavidus taiwanensis]SOY97296.1 Nitronate monooxygenase [Cupriavidus taiwanensis]SOZ00019.1 Nitronate monooxygenase [Cupriavidus taiwanensis]
MMTRPFSTAVTELFGTRLPIVAGGLMWLANADYVAAASSAGILGFITAASLPDVDALRNEIRRCRDLCDGGPFGVNVSMLPKLVTGEKTREVFEAIIDEGVKVVETSGRSPEAFLPMLKEAHVKVLHKVASVRHAVKAADAGVDAVSIVGAECGGHPGLDMVGSYVNAAWAAKQLKIPYLIGGGVGHGSQIVAALAMGASGVVIGTRFLVADEIWAHANYKERLIEAQPTDTDLCMQSVRNTVRSLRNETTATVKAMESENPNITIQELMPYVAGKIGRNAYVTGDWQHGILSAGHALAFVEQREPLKGIVSRLTSEMSEAINRVASTVPY